MHLDQKIRAADLAALVGYTEYNLTHKFKEETGLSVTDYAKFAKIEHTKVLFKSTDLSVQDIATSLSFSTRNYFSRIFQEVTGQTPMEYRGGAQCIKHGTAHPLRLHRTFKTAQR